MNVTIWPINNDSPTFEMNVIVYSQHRHA